MLTQSDAFTILLHKKSIDFKVCHLSVYHPVLSGQKIVSDRSFAMFSGMMCSFVGGN